jgi:transcriptional regulator with XRE-family HTH domain
MSYIQISGEKLRAVIYSNEMSQQDLAKRIGVTRHQVCRWCSKGRHALFEGNVNTICKALNVPISAIAEEYGAARQAEQNLNEQEAEVVRAYRMLSPLDKAKVLIQLLEGKG